MRKVRIVLDEVQAYWLDEEIDELDGEYNPDDIVKLSEKEIKEIEEGLNSHEKLQQKMERLRETRSIK